MMEIQLHTQINCSAQDCWKVFGNGYADIYKWLSGVTSSDAEGEPFGESPVGSRRIKTPTISFSEKLIHFSNEGRTFTYQVIGLPFVVKHATNEWRFTSNGESATLHMHLKLQTATGFGWLLNGLLKKNLTKAMNNLHEDFKYYMENGKVHPRKAKELSST